MNLLIQKQFVGKSIHDFLTFYKVSKAKIHQIRMQHLVYVNGQEVPLDYVFVRGDYLSFDHEGLDQNNIPGSKKEIDIVFEDDDLLIVNKPPYLLVHPDGVDQDTLANRVSFYCQQQGLNLVYGHVHRLDYETSGMVIFAKNFLVQSYLSSLFEEHKIEKKYICICLNRFETLQGVINSPIGKDRHSNKQMVVKNGMSATTQYTVLSQSNKEARVMVQITGGRKHQIRVHMASIHHPIKGDKVYGVPTNGRMMLHFRETTFLHPRTLKEITVVCKEKF